MVANKKAKIVRVLMVYSVIAIEINNLFGIYRGCKLILKSLHHAM